MANKNNVRVEVRNNITELRVEVEFRNGMNLQQFMDDNQLRDVANAKAMLKEAVTVMAQRSFDNLKRSQITKSKRSIYLKGKEARVRETFTAELGKATENDVELLRLEIQRRKEASARTIGYLHDAIAGLIKEPAQPITSNTSERRTEPTEA